MVDSFISATLNNKCPCNLILSVCLQGDLDELEAHMEDNEGAQEKEEVHLGKLQFSIDYDFTQGEVFLQYLCVFFLMKDLNCELLYN